MWVRALRGCEGWIKMRGDGELSGLRGERDPNN